MAAYLQLTAQPCGLLKAQHHDSCSGTAAPVAPLPQVVEEGGDGELARRCPPRRGSGRRPRLWRRRRAWILRPRSPPGPRGPASARRSESGEGLPHVDGGWLSPRQLSPVQGHGGGHALVVVVHDGA